MSSDRAPTAREENEEEESWRCDACGDDGEEGLAIFATGRATRSDPTGQRPVCLCGDCAARKVPHGPVQSS